MRNTWELLVRGVLALSAAVSVFSVIAMTVFILLEGLPLFFSSQGPYDPPGVFDFLFGTEWYPTDTVPKYGILPFITGTLIVTAGSIVISVPVGIAVGIFISEIAKGRVQSLLRSVVELLAGIPSVIYGFCGIMLIGFFLRHTDDPLVNYNAFTAMLILAVMTLPTISTITEVSLRTVPRAYVDGARALGSTHWQTIRDIMLPSASSGILTGVILGTGRAVGETMAVLMVAGNQPTMPDRGIFSRVRTLTMAIVNDMGYAGGDHYVALFSIAIVLFVFILLLNITTQIIISRSKNRMHAYASN
ncbi:MAG: phosphate ABC transporter permease subunit PstC [Spirochaetales bacterium]|nr:phosphate ABC transporter permease subunit PstC [Spirochaetales bacterium]